MQNEEYMKLYEKLNDVEAQVVAIQTDMCWTKKVISWIIVGVAASIGIQLPEFF